MAWTEAKKEARKRRIKNLREQVRALIGWRCHVCGKYGSEIDHIDGRSWLIRSPNLETRWKTYLVEAREGLVKPACPPCNKKRGARLRYTYHLDPAPF